MSEEQDAVCNAVEKRGYREGFSDVQFLARNIAKLMEELGELSELVLDNEDFLGYHTEYQWHILQAAKVSRKYFDDKDYWRQAALVGNGINTIEKIKSEAADCQVVLFNIAGAISRLTGEKYDIARAAAQKSVADVKRGVR